MWARVGNLAHILVVARANEAGELTRELRQRGFTATSADSSEAACQRLVERRWDMVLFDAQAFPPTQAAGERVLELAREKRCAILAIVGSAEEEASRDATFDDFALRPLSMPELAARVLRLARRQRVLTGDQIVRLGELAIDPEKYEVRVSGRPVELTYREYQLLLFLAVHPERVFSREALLDQVWGYDYFGGTRTVDVHVRRLRSKLEDADHQFIETLRNVGYRFRGSEGGGQK